MLIELRQREMLVLTELMKNGRATDKYIAKKIGTTQPTVTRIRQKLERDDIIHKYMAVPNYDKAGITMICLTFYTRMDYTKLEERQQLLSAIKKMPQVMFLSRGEGVEGRTAVIISAHRNFKEYEDFVRDIRKMGGTTIGRFTHFIASPGGMMKQYDSTDAVSYALNSTTKKT